MLYFRKCYWMLYVLDLIWLICYERFINGCDYSIYILIGEFKEKLNY